MAFIFRPTSTGAASLRWLAEKVAKKIGAQGVASLAYKGFLIRATKNDGNTIVDIIELPQYMVGIAGGYPWNPTTGPFHAVYTLGFAGVTGALGGTGTTSALSSADIYSASTKSSAPNGVVVATPGTPPVGTRLYPAYVSQWRGFGLGAICASAVTLPSVMGVTGYTLAFECTGSVLMVCRANAYTAKNLRTTYNETDTGTVVVTEPGGQSNWAIGAPTADPLAAPLDSPMAVTRFDFSNASVGCVAPWRMYDATSCAEWRNMDGSLTGVVAVLEDDYVNPDVAVERLRTVQWKTTPKGVNVEVSVEWSAMVDLVALGFDEVLPAVPAIGGYLVPATAFPMAGRPAVGNTAKMSNTLSSIELARVICGSAAQLSFSSLDKTVLVMATIRTLAPGESVTADARGKPPGSQPEDPYEYGTVSTAEDNVTQFTTFVLSISPLGVVTKHVLETVREDRYSRYGELVGRRWVPYTVVSADDGSPRMAVVRATFPFTITPQVVIGDGTPTPPAYRSMRSLTNYTAASEVGCVLVGGSGAVVPVDLGTDAVWAWAGASSALGGDASRRTGYASNSAGNSNVQPVPFCQYAPGIMAVLTFPKAEWGSVNKSMSISLIRVATGARIAQSSVFFVNSYIAPTASISCVEQGKVDGAGNITAYGRIIFTLGTTASTSNNLRVDGIFMLDGFSPMRKTWIAREPSSIPAAYAGNAFAPAEIGVTTGLPNVTPTPL